MDAYRLGPILATYRVTLREFAESTEIVRDAIEDYVFGQPPEFEDTEKGAALVEHVQMMDELASAIEAVKRNAAEV